MASDVCRASPAEAHAAQVKGVPLKERQRERERERGPGRKVVQQDQRTLAAAMPSCPSYPNPVPLRSLLPSLPPPPPLVPQHRDRAKSGVRLAAALTTHKKKEEKYAPRMTERHFFPIEMRSFFFLLRRSDSLSIKRVHAKHWRVSFTLLH